MSHSTESPATPVVPAQRRMVAAGVIRRTEDGRTTQLTVTAAGVSGRITPTGALR